MQERKPISEKPLSTPGKLPSDVGGVVRRLMKKYVRIKKMGHQWNTYLQIDHQGFCVAESTTKKRAEWFGKMLAVALSRVSVK